MAPTTAAAQATAPIPGSVGTAFELWGMAIDLQLKRLETLVRTFIREDHRAENVIEYATAAKNFDLYSEYGTTLRFVKSHSVEMKPILLQHRALALEILKAKDSDYPEEQLELPSSTLSADWQNFLWKSPDTVVTVNDPYGPNQLSIHRAVLSLYSPYFREILPKNHTNVTLTGIDITTGGLKGLISFWYTGRLELQSAVDAFFALVASTNTLKLAPEYGQLIGDHLVTRLSSNYMSQGDFDDLLVHLKKLNSELKERIRNSGILSNFPADVQKAILAVLSEGATTGKAQKQHTPRAPQQQQQQPEPQQAPQPTLTSQAPGSSGPSISPRGGAGAGAGAGVGAQTTQVQQGLIEDLMKQLQQLTLRVGTLEREVKILKQNKHT